MAFRFILLVLPALALASIDVKISGNYSKDAKALNVYYNGKDIGLISKVERTTFNVTKNTLKNLVSIYMGKHPDDVFVRNPTPWGDLYSKYGWDQVTRTLVPRSGKILRASSELSVVASQTFENNGKVPAIYYFDISKCEANTVASSWSTAGELSVEQKINYDIKIKVVNVGAETSFSYASSWSQNTKQSQTVKVGDSSKITLQPGEAIVARLEATREFVQVEMEYEASLSGQILINYVKPYWSQNFYGLSIDRCMNRTGLSNQKRSREVIDIKFFSDFKVVVSKLPNGTAFLDYKNN